MGSQPKADERQLQRTYATEYIEPNKNRSYIFSVNSYVSVIAVSKRGKAVVATELFPAMSTLSTASKLAFCFYNICT